MSVQTNHLSQVIDDNFKQNFFNFVNSCRIQEIRASLNDPGHKHLTILAVAYEAGFNSKSAFLRCVHEAYRDDTVRFQNNNSRTKSIAVVLT